jgi:VRR-NUC domain
MSARKFSLTVQEPSEGDLQSDALKWLATTGVTHWRANSGMLLLPGRVFRGNPKGCPDILGYLGPHGRMFGLELKTRLGRLSSEQVAWQQRALAEGVRVAVCRSLQEVRDAVGAWQKAEVA